MMKKSVCWIILTCSVLMFGCSGGGSQKKVSGAYSAQAEIEAMKNTDESSSTQSNEPLTLPVDPDSTLDGKLPLPADSSLIGGDESDSTKDRETASLLIDSQSTQSDDKVASLLEESKTNASQVGSAPVMSDDTVTTNVNGYVDESESVGDFGAQFDTSFDDDSFNDDPFGLLDSGDDDQSGQGGAYSSSSYAATSDRVSDPLEWFNRILFAVGRAVDQIIIKPYATILYELLPSIVTERLIDFSSVLDMPSSAVQLLLQGQPRLAAQRFGRFIGSAVFLGIIDIERQQGYLSEDFGQTLAVGGVRRGPFIASLYGLPSNLRDTAVFTTQVLSSGDQWFIHQDPLRYLTSMAGLGTPFSILSYSLLFFERSYSDSSVSYIESGIDPYATYRYVISERREYLINEQNGEFISERESEREKVSSSDRENQDDETQNNATQDRDE